MSRLLKKKIYIYIPYTLFSWLLPDVVAFPEILKQFIMWFVVFCYKLHLFPDMNVNDIEISILYYQPLSFHHSRRKTHCLPKANIKNSFNVSPTVRDKLAVRFVKKRKIKIFLGELFLYWSLAQGSIGSQQSPCIFIPVLPLQK